MKQPIEIACRRCAAQPRFWCEFSLANSEQLFHDERVTDALSWDQDSPEPPSKDEFERAVEESGRI